MLVSSRRQWRSFQRLLMLCAIALLSGACAESEPPATPKRTPAPAQAVTTPLPTRVQAAPDDQTWLVLLYQDADDEILEEDMLNDLNEAELIGSSKRVKIVAQVDRYDGGFDGDGDWTTTKRFLIQK